jgi:hypothetical protein
MAGTGMATLGVNDIQSHRKLTRKPVLKSCKEVSLEVNVGKYKEPLPVC